MANKPTIRLEPVDDLAAGRLVSPSAERNKGPVAGVLKRVLPAAGVVLEVSSGTGQHVVHFASEMPGLTWQPTERDETALRSIAQWLAAERLANIRAPLRLDVEERPWPIGSAAAVVCLNMIHIAPWSAGEALIRGAAEILSPGGVFFLYGPFRRDGRHTAPSNEAFDRQLRSHNPDWGVRDLGDVALHAHALGFGAPETYPMPANNLSVVFRKQ
jgi:SAM-dependent methyltransferase